MKEILKIQTIFFKITDLIYHNSTNKNQNLFFFFIYQISKFTPQNYLCMSLQNFVFKLPKAQLHLHIQGTLEPELMMQLSKKNKIPIKYQTIEEIKNAFKFHNLQEFLDLYYLGMNVLRTEEDFYLLAKRYVEKCRKNNIVHAQIFFDPQGHLERGIQFQTIFNGIYRALQEARAEGNFSFYLIMCFLRHLSEQSAFKTLQLALPFKEKIIGVGLDSTQIGNPPSKHKNVFAEAKKHGFRLVAHSGEQGPSDLIWQTINQLKVERIDHGIRCSESEQLCKYLVENKIGLTVCPFSNLKLELIKCLEEHNLKKLLYADLLVTINSDDPAYFSAYLNQNYIQCAKALDLSKQDLKKIAKNSFEISFLPEDKKKHWIEQIEKISKE